MLRKVQKNILPMNRLEEFIRDHKNLFDEEPATGHFERLQQKMSRHYGRIITLRWRISIAASIAILLTAGLIWQYAGKQDSITLACENASDIKVCYLDQMNVIAGHIEELIREYDPWDQQEVMNDVQNIIDVTNSGFENEIPEELPDDQVQAILADYYRQNLEGLERIVKIITN